MSTGGSATDKECGVDLGQLVAVQMLNQANTGPAEAASSPQG